MNEINAERAKRIIESMKNPMASGVKPGSWLSRTCEVGGGYEPTGMNETGCFIQVDFALEGEEEEQHYVFEPGSKPRNWLECWQATRKEMERIVEES